MINNVFIESDEPGDDDDDDVCLKKMRHFLIVYQSIV